jgi:signal transduction histidine kinase
MKRLRMLLDRVPITMKVPIVVAVLMVAVGAVASERVLSRLVATQERQIRDLTNAYLDGLASPLVEPVLRGDPWEIFDVLDQARQLDAAVRPVETVVTNAAGVVLAGSSPRHAPVGSQLPAEFPAGQDHLSKVLVQEAASRAFVDRRLLVEGRLVGTLHAEFDISQLLAERRDVFRTLLSTNAALTLLFAALGWFAVRQMVRPMKVLSDHLEGAQSGAVKPIPAGQLPSADSEAGRLFRRFNDMARAVAGNEALAARLSDEERLASLGRLASGMAHEINNPLGGLFNAIDTLRKHGDKPVVRAKTVALIERGLVGIRDVVRAALATYRVTERERRLTGQDFDDVRLLLGPELLRRHQTIEWSAASGPLPDLPSTPIRQAVLNLLLNASAASGEGGRLRFCVSGSNGSELLIEIADSGPGMPQDAAAILTGDRTYAMLRDGKGLGLWMVRRLLGEVGGTIDVRTSPAGGALVRLGLRGSTRSEAQSNAA